MSLYAWRNKVLIFFLLYASPVFAGHPGSVDLNPRQATPGLRLEINELPRAAGYTTKKEYKLRAIDYPRDVLFSLFTKDFADSFTEVATGFHVDDTGNMISSRTGKPKRLEEIVISPGLYPRGAVWEVAVASADRSIAAFAQVTPYPIIARVGACLVSFELLTPRGDRFLVTGSGFTAGDEVLTELQVDGRREQKRRRISADGQLPRHVISHAAIGSDRSARYSVKGRSCEIAIDYDWGEPALLRR